MAKAFDEATKETPETDKLVKDDFDLKSDAKTLKAILKEWEAV